MKILNKIRDYFLRNFENNTAHLTEAQKKTRLSYGVLVLNMFAVMILAVVSAIYIKSLFICLLIQLPLFIFFHYNLKKHSRDLKRQKNE
ncbi:hypothetical protein C8D70_12514 [Chryseobacterium sp. CBTAP 102]|uniref:hypothetical protein n=1 Tax=Chryseobacterium sp. CBTAP 102 TaxID=2135644 RepID=UPI000D764BD5|nr:hypothetical protein [Chryseobacterium sp. CBTAP 102]PXW06482.1 hypothetical protein C8D70_12514 [Chryseobacterium sp. CBTAP 102]